MISHIMAIGRDRRRFHVVVFKYVAKSGTVARPTGIALQQSNADLVRSVEGELQTHAEAAEVLLWKLFTSTCKHSFDVPMRCASICKCGKCNQNAMQY